MPQSSNFAFLQDEWKNLWEAASEAEQHCLTIPRHAINLCRISLEVAIHWMYENDIDLDIPYEKTLYSLMTQASFKTIIPSNVQDKLHAIRLAGNQADHSPKKVKPREGLLCVENLHTFLQEFARLYSEEDHAFQVFNESSVPQSEDTTKTKQELERAEQALQQKIQEIERLTILRSEDEAKIKQLEQRDQHIQQRKAKNADRDPIPENPNEAETRLFYIDLLLKEAGWDLDANDVREYPVTGMPVATNPSGKGSVDYMLWGEDGLPLAVVEAKRTLKSAQVGQRQAELYADCLEKMKGQRPIIFYTNGYDTYLWDDQHYPPRRVHGMYTREELQSLINRRKTKKNLTAIPPDRDIAGRFYQIEAIKRVMETLQANRRYALLVMATGSGKTRVAASITDILLKANWAKRVLFLADRTELVSQGKEKFGEFLGDTPMVDITKDKENNNTRIVFSTYPTMMNLIDSKGKTGDRTFSVGHFDLIIVDEAHRSVYNKYQAIFEYFDALMIGLTATPKAEIDHNTYGLFELTDNNPTYAYELEQAIRDEYLVPPRALSVPIKFPREGIKYDELSDREQAEYEESFREEDTGFLPPEIDKGALNNWLFNINTVDQVLTYLMEHGIKVQNGDQLGKTIIFARKHDHAVLIEKRFNALYPEYNGKFLRIIDYQDPKAKATLTDFKNKDKMPRIAVSVDMLDTGIDILEIVNLVFFKRVYSKSKFWQMIGRGTRLCPNLFGPEKDKQEFYVLDFCENFEFFDENPDGLTPTVTQSLSQRIFMAKLSIAEKLKEPAYLDQLPLQQLRQQYLDELHRQIQSLNRENFAVRRQLQYVDAYRVREKWNNLSRTEVAIIDKELSHLPVITDDDEKAKQFDLLLYRLPLAILEGSSDQPSLTNKVITLANGLSQKMNIPVIAHKKFLIDDLKTGEYWNNVSVDHLETVRTELRGLIRHLREERAKTVYSNFQDEIVGLAQERNIIQVGSRLQSYHLRVERYLREHADNLAIQRVKQGEVLTQPELEALENFLFAEKGLGTKEDFIKEFGTDKPLVYFIRSILGFDRGAAKEAFGEFLEKGNLSADQITFINNIIDSLEHNGVIDKGMLFEPPFTNLHDEGAFGLFPEEEATKIFSILDRLNEGLRVNL